MAEQHTAGEHATQHGATSAGHTPEHPATPVEAAPLETMFDRDDLAQFDRDDSAAGSHIGKMLALFFLYTVIAMSLVALWTFSASDH